MENSTTSPLISVVIPAYNAEKYIQHAIDSILNQTYTHLELLIADDASKDNTKKIIESYKDKRVKTFHNKTNQGYLKTCNKLFKFAKGDFIAFQDADDYSDSQRFELQMNAFKENNKLSVVGCNLTAIDINNNLKFCSNYHLNHDVIFSKMPHYYSVIPNSFLLKREVYDVIGDYNEYFDRIGAEDYYWTFLIMEKFELINIKTPLYFYRYNPDSLTGNRSDRLRKTFVLKILEFIINQRIEKSYTSTELGKNVELSNFVSQLEAPYKKDPSLFYRKLAAKYYHQGLKKRGLKLILKAIIKSPLNSSNYRDMIYFIKNL